MYTDSDGTEFVYVASPANSLGNYFKIEPIKWRVLDNDNSYNTNTSETESALFLLSEQNLDQQQYHSSYGTITWENSSLRRWLNGTGSGNFYADAFASGEQSAIAKTYVINDDNTVYSIDGGNNTTDEVFALSIAEVKTPAYGFIDNYDRTDRRESTNTAYTASSGNYGNGKADYWWLRSPGGSSAYAAVVDPDGYLHDGGGMVTNDVGTLPIAVRPALNLNLNFVLFTSAASGEKNSSFTEPADYDGSEWKLTLLDNSRSAFTASISTISANTLTISYSGAATGINEYISALIKDGSGVTHYGRLLQVDGTANSASGTATIMLPDTFDSSTDTLYIFNEQCNGDYESDYASELIPMNVDVTYELENLTFSGNAYARIGKGYTATLSTPIKISNVVRYAICDDVKIYVGDSTTPLTKGTDYTFTPAEGGQSGTLTINAASITGGIKIVAEAKKYKIEVTKPAYGFDFGSAEYDSAVTALTMTINNTGNQPLTITLPTDTGDFEVSFANAGFNGTLAAGSSVEINVKPKDGLNASNSAYEKELTIGITGDNSVDFSQTINAKFVVNKADATDTMKTASGETKYGTSGTVDLRAQLPTGYVLGMPSEAEDTNGVLDENEVAVSNSGLLSFTFVGGADTVGKQATVKVPVTSTNYNDYDIEVTLKVLDKYTQTISFAEPSVTKTYGDAVFTIAANHTAGDGAVIYSSSDETVADVNSGTGAVTIKKASDTPVTITATAAETDDYKEATATYTLTVNKKTLTVQPKALTVYVNSAAPTFELICTGLVDDDTVTPSEEAQFKLYTSDGTTEISADDAVKTAGTYIIRWENEAATTFTDADNYDIAKTAEAELKVNTRPSSGGGYTPPVQSVTVPISGDAETIHVDASVKGEKATVDHVDLDHLDTVIGDHVSTGTVTIDFSGLDSSKPITEVEIPANVVKEIAAAVSDTANDAQSLEVILSDGTSIEFDAAALGEKAAQAGGLDITISIEHSDDVKTLTSAQKNTLGDRPAFDINVTSGGKHISDMGGKITVHAPYELSEGEDPDSIVVFYVDDHGNKERCETSYDPIKKRVNWKTDHLSLYMIDHCPSAAFNDLDTGAWYHEATDYVISNDLMNGYGNGYFGPGDSLSRGMLVQILYNLEGKPAVSGEIVFTDVAADKYYANAISWAQQNNIVGGYGNGLFGPDDSITREQLAAMLYRYEQYKGGGFTGLWAFRLEFNDVAELGDWAYEPMCWCVMNKVVSGKGGGILDPKGDATRAQTAQMLMNYLERAAE